MEIINDEVENKILANVNVILQQNIGKEKKIDETFGICMAASILQTE